MRDGKMLPERLREYADKGDSRNMYASAIAVAEEGRAAAKEGERAMLRAWADEIEADYVPRPRDSEGNVLEVGKRYAPGVLSEVGVRPDGVYTCMWGTGNCVIYGPIERVPVEADTQERIDGDATMLPGEYCAEHCLDLGDDPDREAAMRAMVSDLLRRQRELDGVGA